jgi:hypothetical protein
MENTPLCGLSTGPHCLTPVDWSPYLPDLNPLDSSFWCVLKMKVQATPHANLATLHHHSMREASGGIHLQDLPLIPLPPRSHHGEKWCLHETNGQSTHQPVPTYVPALLLALIRHNGLYIDKNTFNPRLIAMYYTSTTLLNISCGRGAG